MTAPPARARIHRPTATNLVRLAMALRRGELVAVPTETVYGLAADATNATACAAIFTAKARPPDDPLIVHLADAIQLDQVAVPNNIALRLAHRFWPGPLTLVLPKRTSVPDIVTAGLPSVAVRVPAHPVFRRLLRITGRPLAAPSANPFGYVSPTTAQHVRDGLGQRIRFILDGGPCRIGVESTIVDVRDPAKVRVLRPGAITVEQLSDALGQPVTQARRAPAAPGPAVAPGLLDRHYSPRTPLTLHPRLPAAPLATPGEARVYFCRPPRPLAGGEFFLTRTGDGHEAARRLFGLLRELDDGRWRVVHWEMAPAEAALAAAINDRLGRAAAR